MNKKRRSLGFYVSYKASRIDNSPPVPDVLTKKVFGKLSGICKRRLQRDVPSTLSAAHFTGNGYRMQGTQD